MHAVAGGSNSIAPAENEADYTRTFDPFSRIPLNVVPGPVRRIGASGDQIVMRHMGKCPGELADVEWLKPEQIRGFNGEPIRSRERWKQPPAAYAKTFTTAALERGKR